MSELRKEIRLLMSDKLMWWSYKLCPKSKRKRKQLDFIADLLIGDTNELILNLRTKRGNDNED